MDSQQSIVIESLKFVIIFDCLKFLLIKQCSFCIMSQLVIIIGKQNFFIAQIYNNKSIITNTKLCELFKDRQKNY